MIVETGSTEIGSLHEMDRRGMKACVKRGAAYAAHMPELFPDIDLVPIDPRFPGEAVDRLEDGDCDAYVDSLATLELIKGLRDHCDADLTIPAQPLRYGDIDMAVGVRDGVDPGVRDALSYWITKLRYCSSTDEDPVCHGKWNLDDMWNHWAEDHCVDDVGYSGNAEQIGLVQFSIPLAIVGFVASVVLAREATRAPFLARLRTCGRARDGGLIAVLKATRAWWHEDDATLFLMDAYLGDATSGETGPTGPLRGALLDYYLLADTAAWDSLRRALAKLERVNAAEAADDNEESFARVRAPTVALVRDLLERAAHDALTHHKLHVAKGQSKKARLGLGGAASPTTPVRSLSKRASSLLGLRRASESSDADAPGSLAGPGSGLTGESP